MIVWATARECRAKILTGDEHFHDLVGEAIMMRKQESHEFVRGSVKEPRRFRSLPIRGHCVPQRNRQVVV